MNKHRKLAATMHMVIGVLAPLLFVMIFMMLVCSGCSHGPTSGNSPLVWGSCIVGLLEAGAAFFCWRNQLSNARYILMVLSLPLLFAFPVGTVLGAYTLWAFMRSGTAHSSPELFRS